MNDKYGDNNYTFVKNVYNNLTNVPSQNVLIYQPVIEKINTVSNELFDHKIICELKNKNVTQIVLEISLIQAGYAIISSLTLKCGCYDYATKADIATYHYQIQLSNKWNITNEYFQTIYNKLS